MKKILGLLVISFLCINTAYSREYPSKIFGINLFDKFDSYVSDKSKYSGKLSNLKKPWPYLKVRPNLNLIQEYSFSIASIYVDSGSEIVGIVGTTRLPDQKQENFKMRCENKKDNLIKKIIKKYDIPKKVVENLYWTYSKSDSITTSASWRSEAHISYYLNNVPVRLRVTCGYTLAGSSDVNTDLTLSLSTDEFFKDYLKFYELRYNDGLYFLKEKFNEKSVLTGEY